MHISQHAELH